MIGIIATPETSHHEFNGATPHNALAPREGDITRVNSFVGSSSHAEPLEVSSIEQEQRQATEEHRPSEETGKRKSADVERAKEILQRFKKDPKKEELLEKVRTSFVEWRDERVSKLSEDLQIDVHATGDDKLCQRRKDQINLFITPKRDEWHREPRQGQCGPGQVEEPLDEFKAGVMHFEKCKKKQCQVWHGAKVKHNHELYTGDFPDQKITMKEFLDNKDLDPFGGEGNKLRYIHFPANHMDWIEKAVEKYYKEDYDNAGKPVTKKERTNQLLSREHWRGQLHGSGLGKTLVHARHMRPRCSHIPLDTQSAMMTQKRQDSCSQPSDSADDTKTPPNFAIFLPYLHWETNRRRSKMAEVVWDVTRNDDATKGKSTGRQRVDPAQGPAFPKVVERVRKKPAVPKFKPTKLGRYLLNLAQVWDAMDYEADERLVRHSLWGENGCTQQIQGGKLRGEPPLHIRRTLDQSYFLTLEDTTKRDTDQVVYRQTRMRTEAAADDAEEKGNRNNRSQSCRQPDCDQCKSKSHESSQDEEEPETKWKLEGITRVVMVDQLWMWILDEHTIITAFPRRWGRNKPDSSGVHKSLRETIKKKEIRSVYHLALLIIDQCSRVFFDRTQPTDNRPEVMDLFAQAVGTVTDNTTMAFELFWNNVKWQPMNVDANSSEDSTRSYLNINPEGVLLRESQDIAEELSIMERIFKQQSTVVNDFKKYMDTHHAEFERASNNTNKPTKRQRTLMKTARRADTVEAADFIEQIKNRTTEINELKKSVAQTTVQLQELLTLKQQQAGIVEAKAGIAEAKAALTRADESVRQGRTIMAFTVVTIFFLPLGFFAAFFGMNNAVSTGNEWMTLKEQIMYMFVLSAVVINISLSVAFVPWVRLALEVLVKLPTKYVWEYLYLERVFKLLRLDYQTLQSRKDSILKEDREKIEKRNKDRERKEGERKEREQRNKDHMGRGERSNEQRCTGESTDGSSLKDGVKRRRFFGIGGGTKETDPEK